MSTAPAALDDYLQDLLAGDFAPAPALRAAVVAPETPAAVARIPAEPEPAPRPREIRPVTTHDEAIGALSALAEAVAASVSLGAATLRSAPLTPINAVMAEFDEEFPDQAPVAPPAPEPAPGDTAHVIDTAADLLAEFDSEFPDQAPADTAHVIDTTADLLAEFDSEFPDQAPADTAHVIDTTADLLAEFDSEFPDQAPAETAHVIDATADLLAEFDAEFPQQAHAETAHANDTTADLLAEFDAEFPAQAQSPAFAAAVAEETAADTVRPAPVSRAPALPATPIPAYAKPVYDLLQKQVQDEQERAHSPTGDRRRAADRTSRWLRMRCDDQHYALELLKVQEVVLPATLLPLRGAASHMLGVMNLRGQVVPVIDLGIYLGRNAIEGDAQTRIVVLEEQGEILGLRVSAVEDVTNLTEQQIEPPDNTRMCRITHPLFRGVARLANRTVILLDASELLK